MKYTQVDCLDFDPKLFPLRRGKYEVVPGLSPLSDDIFLRDELYHDYLDQKKACFEEGKNKYICTDREYIENEERYLNFLNECAGLNACDLDEFSLLVQEDFSIVKGDKALMISLCFPNHWDPCEKISQNFNDIHIPVADFGPIAKNAQRLCRSMIERGPFKRFAWGLATDTRLNHHPVPPAGVSADLWGGRSFKNDGNHKLYMRVERQHMVGLAQLDSFLFTIRTYFLDVAQIPEEQLTLLQDAVNSMSEETMAYKGVAKNKDEINSYLNNLIKG